MNAEIIPFGPLSAVMRRKQDIVAKKIEVGNRIVTNWNVLFKIIGIDTEKMLSCRILNDDGTETKSSLYNRSLVSPLFVKEVLKG